MLAFLAALILLGPSWGFRLVGPRTQTAGLAASSRSDWFLEEARRLREEAELLLREARSVDDIKGSEFVAQFRDKLPASALEPPPLQTTMADKVIVDRMDTERAANLYLKKISGERSFAFTLEKDILTSVTNLISIVSELELVEDSNLTLEQLTEKVAENLGWFGKPVFRFFVSEVSKLLATELKLAVTPEEDVNLRRCIASEVLHRIQQSGADANGVAGASLFEDILVDLDSGGFALAVQRRFEAGGKTKGGVKLEDRLDLLANVVSTCTALNARIRSIEQRVAYAASVASVPVSVVGENASATAMIFEEELAEEQAALQSSVITLLESVAEIALSLDVLRCTSELVSELKVSLISARELRLQQHGEGVGRRDLTGARAGAGVPVNSTGLRGVRGEGWGMGLEELIAKAAEGDIATTSAERLVLTYFDQSSRIPVLGSERMSAPSESSLDNDVTRSGVIGGGLGISRLGAGKFQSEVLRGAMSVTSVKLLEGAVIFEGTLLVPSSELCEHIERRLDESPDLRGQVGFTVLMSESLPSMDQGLQKMALDILLGQSPAVIVFPKAWNSTVAAAADDSMRIWWRNVLSASSVVTSFVFAANCVGMFDEKQLLLDGRFPDGFVGLALAPIFLSALTSALETVVAKTKGINVTTVIIPTLTLFNFGSRATYVTMPRNRDDLFDVAAITAGFSIVNSLALTLYGLSLTASASSEVLLSYPKISSSLLQSNTVLGQLMANFYPAWSGLANTVTNGLGQGLSGVSGGFAVDSGIGGWVAGIDMATGVGNADVFIHVHWLVVVGSSMFLGSVLQLLPIDNTWGAKMFLAVFGKEQFELLTIFSVFFKAIIFLAPLFGGAGRPRLILDFILASQLAGSSSMVSLAPP